ncbi:uncharacterized protein LOC127249056 [Andrographis paniculata]|uniref:uncharacterized protein LOC127249056 n=1 Tax=Andrographis paniculata TaxID=175694 RepID=UPI0021E7C9A1|nr:uncharacterized protein LOC127249056 [Andrographis paniculata]
MAILIRKWHSGDDVGVRVSGSWKYRQMRRKEQDRLARMDADFRERKELGEFAQRREERLKAAEERTAKKCLKRQKKKQRKKKKMSKPENGGLEYNKEQQQSSDDDGESDK